MLISFSNFPKGIHALKFRKRPGSGTNNYAYNEFVIYVNLPCLGSTGSVDLGEKIGVTSPNNVISSIRFFFMRIYISELGGITQYTADAENISLTIYFFNLSDQRHITFHHKLFIAPRYSIADIVIIDTYITLPFVIATIPSFFGMNSVEQSLSKTIENTELF